MGTAELVLALLGLPALAAFVTHWFDRRKTNGEASLAYAQASGLAAEQSERMSVRFDGLQTRFEGLQLKFTDLECGHKILQASYDLAMPELQKRDTKIEGLQLEIRNLRLALEQQLKE